ncbi:MAG: hypothetical protein ACYDAY_03435 [Candidatus Dormibacteria bacterium]
MDSDRRLDFLRRDHSREQAWRSLRLIFGRDDECRLVLALALAQMSSAEAAADNAFVESAGEWVGDLSPTFVDLVSATAGAGPERSAEAILRACDRTGGASFVADAVIAWQNDARRWLAEPAPAPKRRRVGWFRR